jgi:hypothetical protein
MVKNTAIRATLDFRGRFDLSKEGLQVVLDNSVTDAATSCMFAFSCNVLYTRQKNFIVDNKEGVLFFILLE